MRKGAVKLFLLFFIITLFFNSVSSLSAQTGRATLFLSPAQGTYIVNKSFTLKVMVDSGGETGINAAEGILKYDPTYLT